MRFAEIGHYHISQLTLDQENYRFTGAQDQRECIQRIHQTNPEYFSNLIDSVARADLGEPLLVFRTNGGDNIVKDGNRRTAALKVLYEPDLAPTQAIRKRCITLNETASIQFDNIHAQVSDNEDLIIQTVHERHAAGKGLSRIGWNALASARFRYENLQEDGKDWYAMALLLKAEEGAAELKAFVDTGHYSHEVFRRLVRAAIDKDKINEEIFTQSGNSQRIKKTANKASLDHAIDIARQLLYSMKRKKITLSRNESYADKRKVDEFVDTLADDPTVAIIPSAPGNEPQTTDDRSDPTTNRTTETGAQESDASNDVGTTAPPQYNEDDASPLSSRRRRRTKIPESARVHSALQSHGTYKLQDLYRSLCIVSANEHPMLIIVGAWSFLESLASALGKDSNTSFQAFFNGKLGNWGFDRGEIKTLKLNIEAVNKDGNASKHDHRHVGTSHENIINAFDVLEPFLVDAISRIPQR